MNNIIDFKELRSKQETTVLPEAKDLVNKADRFKKEKLIELYVLNLLFILIAAFSIIIWISYQPEMLTTKIGIVMVIVSMLPLVVSTNKTFHLLKQDDVHMNSSQFLKQLIALKEKQQFLQTTMLTSFFILFSIGMALYTIEFAIGRPLDWSILQDGFPLFWVVFVWFYFRPKIIKKRQRKIDELISRFENLNKQFQSIE